MSVLNDMLSVLNDFDVENFDNLVKISLIFVVEKKSDVFQKDIELFSEQFTGDKLALRAALKALIIFLDEGLRNAWNVSQIDAHCVNAGLDKERTSLLLFHWRSQSQRLSERVLSSVLTTNQLVDVEWSFGVTCATEDCDEVSQTFVQLRLVVEEGVPGAGIGTGTGAVLRQLRPKRKTVLMELTVEQFYAVLAQLESARAYLSLVTGDAPADVRAEELLSSTSRP